MKNWLKRRRERKQAQPTLGRVNMPTKGTLKVKVIRADGSVEDYGTVGKLT